MRYRILAAKNWASWGRQNARDLPWAPSEYGHAPKFGHRLDLNILPVWQDYDGMGVRSGVFDEGRKRRPYGALRCLFFKDSFFEVGMRELAGMGTGRCGIIGAIHPARRSALPKASMLLQ